MTAGTRPATSAPLAGLLVVDLSTTLPGAQATQFLADAGADVVLVEPPGGSPLRADPGWPGLLRGKRSITLDIGLGSEDRPVLDGLLLQADVLVTTMRPAAAERHGFTAQRLAEAFPRLVAAKITGWGSHGPWADYKGYESLVMAKTGVMHSKRQLSPGPDPAYVSTPYACYAAAQTAVQGILAALFERESSGLGQVVESDLVSSVGALDPYNWFYEMILHRYPDAFTPQIAAFDAQGRPQTRLMYALLVAATKDGTWLQFAHTAPRLMQAWLEELGLADELKDPKWTDFPDLPTPELRFEWWTRMLAEVGARTLPEWEATFARNSNVFGEQFRTPDQALDHPQILHEGRAVTVDDPDLGPVRQPSTLVHAAGRPLTEIRRAPRPGEHSEELRRLAALAAPELETPSTQGTAAGTGGLPLAGVTILELGGMFAAPYGATLLTDLGARVIKVEPLEGDTIRSVMAFPEAGGAKVLQGKESIALDLRTPEGLAVVLDLARRSDLVLQCYRAGVTERLGIDEASLKAVNPDLVYLNSPGYGIDGPYGHKPAYAPSIGAASGIALTDAATAGASPANQEELLRGARERWAGGAVPAVQADGIAALSVGSALLLGLYARRRGIALTGMVTTMLGSCTQALIGRNTSYADRPPLTRVDDGFQGTGPLHRLYRASDGWVFLAASAERDWSALATALSSHSDLGNERFSTADARDANGDALTDVLSRIFATRTKDAWEADLTARDVGCVAVCQENAEWRMQSDEFHRAGYAVDAVSPIFDEHRRLAPLSRFSRSAVKADAGCTLGQHTDALLRELGRSAESIADLRSRDVVR
ncbi:MULTISPECIES: CaiB/BaiF CoA-transferase family protein [Streptacidiphilus]|uniref:CaiB/BaiF CoA transferase family protein n=1 Tax=Streptacidiphilus cavernicola TaxID=3342716 RepID=A0ABV6UV37_9ACTN|nr:CoA transferase [Streptacidiphilus jeojiense]